MENNQTDASAHGEDSAEQKSKKPYSRPAFQYEKVFETMALACGKIGLATSGCAGSPKAS